jgi:hypothetical protein
MSWTGEEKFDCICGNPAAVTLMAEDGASLFCFAHSYGSGLLMPLGPKPEDWPDEPTPEQVRELFLQSSLSRLDADIERTDEVKRYRQLERSMRAAEDRRDQTRASELFDELDALEESLQPEVVRYLERAEGPVPESLIEKLLADDYSRRALLASAERSEAAESGERSAVSGDTTGVA